MISPSDILHGTILIVDDQEANVVLLERMLRGAGYDAIASTRDPRAVCGLHREHVYDLILLDLQMPGMDGFQVLEDLKKIERDGYPPVLAVTAHPGHKLRALQGGAKDFISKPFDQTEVLLRVRNMLEVRLLHKEQENLNTFKTSLVSLVSHEFGNALAVMQAAVFLLREKLPQAWLKENEELLGMIASNITGLTAATQNLLDMGRHEAGRLAIDLAPTDAGQVLRDVMERLQLLYEKRDLAVSLELCAGLPPLKADAAALTLVISNLLSNAIKYTPPGGRIVLAVLREGSSPARYRLSVQDTGIGLSKEEADKILGGSAYYRTESGKAMAAKGFGIGLSLVKLMLEAHGSALELESSPGNGSRFAFLLSAYADDPAARAVRG